MAGTIHHSPGFTHRLDALARKDPLGPISLNSMQSNVGLVDSLALAEHFAAGGHNAPEVPWVLGHTDNATTGYLFDTAFGGGTIARPATGRATVSVVSGVIGSGTGLAGATVPVASVIANVSDALVASDPHIIEAELVSSTSVELRVWQRVLTHVTATSYVWSLRDRALDVAVHAQKQPGEDTLLSPYLLKQRREFLTEQTTDWNALVSNQGKVRKAAMLEHASDGSHMVNRVAKASGWFRPAAGPSFSLLIGHGVASVSRLALGAVEVTLTNALSSTNLAACFPQAQPASADENVIVNGYCFSTTKFRFYIWAYDAGTGIWSEADRPFYASMFGAP